MDAITYTIIKKIAVGGMAEILLGRQASGFNRYVVLKRILPEHAKDQTFVSSFLNEARLSAQLSHPNIVQIYDLGKQDGSYFIAMEYLRGIDLSILIDSNRKHGAKMPLAVALKLFGDICAGLDYAHRATDIDGNPLGVIHRDVTPSNIIVAVSGAAKLIDFGIAKATQLNDDKTRTGLVKGKLSYLSPEQITGAPLDKQVDIFSAGITLYEMLANQTPFKGGNDYESLQNIANARFRPIRELRAELPPELQDIFQKALAKDPKQRYQSAADMLTDIQNLGRKYGLALSEQEVRRYIDSIKDRVRMPEPLGDEPKTVEEVKRARAKKTGENLIQPPRPPAPPTATMVARISDLISTELVSPPTEINMLYPQHFGGESAAGFTHPRFALPPEMLGEAGPRRAFVPVAGALLLAAAMALYAFNPRARAWVAMLTDPPRQTVDADDGSRSASRAAEKPVSAPKN